MRHDTPQYDYCAVHAIPIAVNGNDEKQADNMSGQKKFLPSTVVILKDMDGLFLS